MVHSRMDVARKNKKLGTNGHGVQSHVELPSPDTKRWVARRKAQVVYAVQAGVISLTEACETYALSVEEFLCWQRAIENNGVPGLRATRLQKYRAQNAANRSNV